MSHTPGPWFPAQVKGSYQVPFRVEDSQGRLVAVCHGDQLDPGAISIGEARHNADLIAAAPDLLVQLQRLLSLWEEAIGWEKDYMDMGDPARAAISKAKGEVS